MAPTASAATPATLVVKPSVTEGAPVVKPTLKKETVRIDVPAASVKPTPQATVRIPSAPASTRPPVAEVRLVPATAAVPVPITMEEDEENATPEDFTMTLVAGGVLLFSLVSFGMQLWTFLTN